MMKSIIKKILRIFSTKAKYYQYRKEYIITQRYATPQDILWLTSSYIEGVHNEHFSSLDYNPSTIKKQLELAVLGTWKMRVYIDNIQPNRGYRTRKLKTSLIIYDADIKKQVAFSLVTEELINNKKEFEIFLVWVEKEHRENQIGSLILEQIAKKYSAIGIVRARCYKASTTAKNILHKCGFITHNILPSGTEELIKHQVPIHK